MRTPRADIEQRRHQAAQLWLRGVSTRAIAQTLHASQATIITDLAAVRAELVREHRQEFEALRARSVAHLRTVQAEAWQLHKRLADDRTNKVASLNTIVQAEQLIAKLEGTLGPDTLSVSAVQIVRVANDSLERASADPRVAELSRQLLAAVAGAGAVPGGVVVDSEQGAMAGRAPFEPLE